jgi:protein arginine kinase activator
MHLCEECARENELLPDTNVDSATPKTELNLPAILKLLIGQHVSPMSEELGQLTCPACGIQYMEFRHEGRLGCPHDYEVFRTGLEPILERVHHATRHIGKAPRNRERTVARQRELLELRRRLAEAVQAEHYEEAAQLRDLIRQKEGTDEPR